jgi:hypothetical protein
MKRKSTTKIREEIILVILNNIWPKQLKLYIKHERMYNSNNSRK